MPISPSRALVLSTLLAFVSFPALAASLQMQVAQAEPQINDESAPVAGSEDEVKKPQPRRSAPAQNDNAPSSAPAERGRQQRAEQPSEEAPPTRPEPKASPKERDAEPVREPKPRQERPQQNSEQREDKTQQREERRQRREDSRAPASSQSDTTPPVTPKAAAPEPTIPKSVAPEPAAPEPAAPEAAAPEKTVVPDVKIENSIPSTVELPVTKPPIAEPERAAPKPVEPTPAPSPETAVQPEKTSEPVAPQQPKAQPPAASAPEGELPLAPPPSPAAKRSDAAPPTTFTPGFRSAGPVADSIDDVQRSRRERRFGRNEVIEESDNRMIIRQPGRTIIRHDETSRFAGDGRRVRSDRRDNGEVETVVTRDGVEVYNIVDANGRTLRRYRRDRDGREVNIIDNRGFYEGLAAGAAIGAGIGLAARPVALPPPRLSIPRDEYIVDYDDASEEDIFETLNAPPVERLLRRYSLDEVRYSPRLRERTRRLDLDTVNFTSGSWSIASSQYSALERVADAINRIIEKNPEEVFLIEGHTDAVGSDLDNLSLSDRRAESVARVLSDEFDVPPENLVTQGYGEEFLKIPTQQAERENRRVAVRRITSLIAKK